MGNLSALPLGLFHHDVANISQILVQDPTLAPSINILLSNFVAKNTYKSYNSVIKTFRQFMTDYSVNHFFNFDEQDIIKFIAHCVAIEKRYPFFKKLKPSLRLLERSIGRKISAFSDFCSDIIESSKRWASERRGPVKKANSFHKKDLRIMHDYVFKDWDDKKYINMAYLRALIRCFTFYFSFCRPSDYSYLSDHYVKDRGDYIVLTFPHSKQDQLYQGTNCIIPSTPQDDHYCPVKLYRFYFQYTGLIFENPLVDVYFLNFQFHKQDLRPKPIKYSCLSKNNSVKYTRALLKDCQCTDRWYTDKSFKQGGVSDFMHIGGATLSEAMIAGRWRGETTPLNYRNDDERYRFKISKKLRKT